MFMITNEIVANFFTVPEFKKICRKDNNEKFDAVIIEAMSDLSLYVLAHRFNAPLIGILSLGIHNYHRYIFGSPILPSHPSNWEVNTLVEGNLSFWQRLQNFIDVWSYLYYWTHHNAVRNGIEENFESDTPNVIDIVKNMSIFLVNENPLFAYARPEQPNVIFFTGFHIQKTPPLLPEDLRQFLDDATEGFLYVSLGTTVSCRNVPKEIVGNFIQVFSKLRYKIVWKYECDELPGKLDNALMSQWFPQQGILAHPNIRLFIYQGGQQSTEEAVHYAVPLLGIPIIFEQASRIQRLASHELQRYEIGNLFMEVYRQSYTMIGKINVRIFNDPVFKKVYKRDNDEKFDAVIVEAISDLSLFALVYRFKASLIGQKEN
ncbi:hypothetical protein DMN91_001182 [Ooceraea biroi]|uniref:UDP-glucuronosyltransferase n=1 Tax=Ooceraea biroi TaxID=2015173 RepID=A0A3L8E6R7_OOCBI|nr:hypothetical protein DMN91_001182 [Ooceraea biroi]